MAVRAAGWVSAASVAGADVVEAARLRHTCRVWGSCAIRRQLRRAGAAPVRAGPASGPAETPSAREASPPTSSAPADGAGQRAARAHRSARAPSSIRCLLAAKGGEGDQEQQQRPSPGPTPGRPTPARGRSPARWRTRERRKPESATSIRRRRRSRADGLRPSSPVECRRWRSIRGRACSCPADEEQDALAMPWAAIMQQYARRWPGRLPAAAAMASRPMCSMRE